MTQSPYTYHVHSTSTVTTSESSPAALVAEQMYLPPLAYLALEIVRWPSVSAYKRLRVPSRLLRSPRSLTFTLASNTLPSSRAHISFGFGYPLAVHSKKTLEPVLPDQCS